MRLAVMYLVVKVKLDRLKLSLAFEQWSCMLVKRLIKNEGEKSNGSPVSASICPVNAALGIIQTKPVWPAKTTLSNHDRPHAIQCRPLYIGLLAPVTPEQHSTGKGATYYSTELKVYSQQLD